MTRLLYSAIAVLYAYAVAAAAGSLFWPLGRDQGIFAWAGDVILRGGVPYRDAWDVKGIAAPYTYALAQLLFGQTLWGIRAFDLILLAIAAWALHHFLRHFCDPVAAYIGSAYFVLMNVYRGYWATSQPDEWATFAVVCSLAVLVRPCAPTARQTLIAGALVGLAALYKILFLLFLAPLAVHLLVSNRAAGLASISKWLGMLVAGAGGVLLLSCLALWIGGALDDFLQIQFEFNRLVHAQTHEWDLGRIWKRITSYFRWFRLLFPFMIVGVVVLWRRHRELLPTLVLLFAVAIFIVVAQNKYYSYHWHPVRMCIVIFASFGISGVLGWVADRAAPLQPSAGEGARAALVIVLVGLALWVGPPLNRPGWSALVFGTLPIEDYYRPYKSYYNASFHFHSNYLAAQRIERETSPDESVLVWGFEPMINFLAKRRSPTRFGYNYPIIASAGMPFEQAYRAQFMQDLGSDPPRYIVVGIGDMNSLMPRSSLKELGAFRPLAKLLADRYVLDSSLVGFELWRRREGS